MSTSQNDRHHVVVVGGGFGGLNAALELSEADVDVTLIDRRNYHLFQPLLYQVAMAGLSPGDIAAPLRAIFRGRENVRVRMAEVRDLDPDGGELILDDGSRMAYDSLIFAVGARYTYFGNAEWRKRAPGLEGIEQALEIRRQVLSAYEEAEQEPDRVERQAWMTFVIVGAGPTGVELAGAMAEMAHHTLRGDFRRIDAAETRILLIEMDKRVLAPFPPDLSDKARQSLENLGVTVRTESRVVKIEEDHVVIEQDGESERIHCRTVLWAAGVRAADLTEVIARRTGAGQDRAGRIRVDDNLNIPDHPDIYALGDMVHFEVKGEPLPGLAPVAIQQGKHAAKQILSDLSGRGKEPFHYFDKGTMATIGRASAVAEVGRFHFWGILAWLVWLFVHLMYLVGFRNRLVVFIQWLWNYATYRQGVRLITSRAQLRREEPEADPG